MSFWFEDMTPWDGCRDLFGVEEDCRRAVRRLPASWSLYGTLWWLQESGKKIASLLASIWHPVMVAGEWEEDCQPPGLYMTPCDGCGRVGRRLPASWPLYDTLWWLQESGKKIASLLVSIWCDGCRRVGRRLPVSWSLYDVMVAGEWEEDCQSPGLYMMWWLQESGKKIASLLVSHGANLEYRDRALRLLYPSLISFLWRS